MIANAMRHILIAPVSAAALLAAPGISVAQTDQNNVIVLKDFHFTPMSLSVPAGTTVIWKNLDGEPHTVVSDAGLFRSGGLDQNDSFSFKFENAGTYRFICSIHPTMVGTITVK
jgi:plastocyanin